MYLRETWFYAWNRNHEMRCVRNIFMTTNGQSHWKCWGSDRFRENNTTLDVREHTVRDNTTKFHVMLPHLANKYLMMDICTRKRRITRQRQNVFTLFTFNTSFLSFQSVYCLLVSLFPYFFASWRRSIQCLWLDLAFLLYSRNFTINPPSKTNKINN